jgi:hypothetical protein
MRIDRGTTAIEFAREVAGRLWDVGRNLKGAPYNTSEFVAIYHEMVMKVIDVGTFRQSRVPPGRSALFLKRGAVR